MIKLIIVYYDNVNRTVGNIELDNCSESEAIKQFKHLRNNNCALLNIIKL